MAAPEVTAAEHDVDGLLEELVAAMAGVRQGLVDVRLPRRGGLAGQVVDGFNALVELQERRNREMLRISRVVGREGRMLERMNEDEYDGSWRAGAEAVNSLIDDLSRPTSEIARVIAAVAEGDLSQHMALEIEGRPLRGEFNRIGRTVNTMVDQLSSFAVEVTRVAREVGTDGKLGGQADVHGVSGTWRALTDSVNTMASNLTNQVRSISSAATAIAQGDLSRKITVIARGEIAELAETINSLTDTLRVFAHEVTRVAREVGTEGRLGGQATVPNVAGTWKDLTDAVNQLAANLTEQVRNIAQVTTAVAKGDLTQKITVDAHGEMVALKDTVNTMVDQLSSFADEVTRVAREVGTEGKLGGQAQVRGVAGTWRDLTDTVNYMASNLTSQVRNIAQVTTAVAKGDLTQKITVDAQGEILAMKSTVNTMVDQLSSFADEVTRVAREVGTEGKLGGQAQVEGVSGTWRNLTENVNQLATTLTIQLRAIAGVSTAVTRGDLTQQIGVQASGEVADLKDNINQMIVTLRETTTQNANQSWLDSNLARIGGLLQGQRDLTAVCQMIMNEVVPLVDGQAGAFFLNPGSGDPDSKQEWRLYGSYALGADDVPVRFGRGDGLVGQAADTKQVIVIKGATANFAPIRSGTGTFSPTVVARSSSSVVAWTSIGWAIGPPRSPATSITTCSERAAGPMSSATPARPRSSLTTPNRSSSPGSMVMPSARTLAPCSAPRPSRRHAAGSNGRSGIASSACAVSVPVPSAVTVSRGVSSVGDGAARSSTAVTPRPRSAGATRSWSSSRPVVAASVIWTSPSTRPL